MWSSGGHDGPGRLWGWLAATGDGRPLADVLAAIKAAAAGDADRYVNSYAQEVILAHQSAPRVVFFIARVVYRRVCCHDSVAVCYM